MPKQILLVDDSVTIHRMVEITFAQEDFALTAVKSADEGIAKAKSLKPDLVLADAGLAGKTGYDVVAAIRGDGALANTACLLLTGNFSPYDEGKGGSVGADGFVVKPFDTQQLIDKAKDAIQRRASGAPASTSSPAIAAVPKAAAPNVLQPPPAAARGVEPLGKPLSPVAAETSQRISAQPAAPAKPATAPNVLQPPPSARPAPKATLMGIPAVDPAMLGTKPPPPAAPAAPPVTAKPAAPPAPAPNVLRPPAPAPLHVEPPKPTPAPVHVEAPKPAPAPVHVEAPKPAPHAMPQNVPTMPRPSLVPGVATPTAAKPVEAKPAPAMSPAVRDVAQKTVDAIPAAMAAKGPEYEAIARLSREVIEQVVWEVVPELAETIIRAELDRLVRERQNA